VATFEICIEYVADATALFAYPLARLDYRRREGSSARQPFRNEMRVVLATDLIDWARSFISS
jgi:hypothetical protein